MSQIADPDTAPDTIEATVNYFLDSGETPFTYTGGPGSTEVRREVPSDPRE